MTATINAPLKILRLDIHDVMQIQALTVNAEGRHVVLSGPNDVGKSSTVEAIWAAFKNVSKNVTTPIRKGAAKASVRVDLGDLIVERKWTDKGGMTLVVASKDGSEYRRPQELLNGLLSVTALDPVAFASLHPAEQIKMLLQVVGVSMPVAEVAAVCGEEIATLKAESPFDYLERLTAEGSGMLYCRRRDLGRTLAQKDSAAQEQARVVDSLGGPPPEDLKPLSVTSMLEQLERLEHQARSKWTAKSDLDDLRATAERHLLGVKRQQAAAIDLERQISELQKKLAEVLRSITDGTSYCDDEGQQIATAAKAYERMPDPAPQIAELKKQISGAELANATLGKRSAAAEQLLRLRADQATVAADYERADEALKAVRALGRKLLDGATLGVDGLSIENGDLLLNGTPFRQAAMSKRLHIGCMVAMKQKPDLRLLRIDEGERLDEDSQRLLLRYADEQGFQVVMTRVARGDGLKVEFVEGGNGDGK